MSRYCEHCGSDDLLMVKVCEGYWRKECADCGATGAFVIEPPVVQATSPAPRETGE